MKLSVSNIAWDTSRMDEHLKILADNNCQGMELSPSMIWPEPADVPYREISRLKGKINGYGLEIPSMHSLTYPRPDLTLFERKESRDQLVNYIVRLGEISNHLECPVMVFGSAKSRAIGHRDLNHCFQEMTAAFGSIAESLRPLGVSMLIEPLSKTETDCINNCKEAMALIESVDHPNFALHVDLRSAFAEGEDQRKIWSEYAPYIFHCHVADPEMRPPSAECVEHVEAASCIRKSSYDKYISIEIKRCFGETSIVVEQAIKFIQNTYIN